MEGEIRIRLPINGRVTVSALSRGKSKIQAVEMYEQVSSRFQKVFQRWYEMQFRLNEEDTGKTAKEYVLWRD